MISTPKLDGYETRWFTFAGRRRPVLERGQGPAVLIMTEVPQITPSVLRFAERIVEEGYRVALPHFIGHVAEPPSLKAFARSGVRACISREFSTFARGRTSPIVDWMRALAKDLHARNGGPGVGVVGMCLTGGFALACVTEPAVVAAVGAQPSLPFALSPEHRADLGIDPKDMARARERIPGEAGFVGMRFSCDGLSPKERFETLRKEFGDAVKLIEIDSSWGNPHGIRRLAHSVLTEDYVDRPGHPTFDAQREVFDLFRQRLKSN